MLESTLNIRPNDFSLKMFEVYLNKKDIKDILSEDELHWLEQTIQKMQSPYIFKFSALVVIRGDREERQTSCKYLRGLDSTHIPILFLTRQEHYHRRREELRKTAYKQGQ